MNQKSLASSLPTNIKNLLNNSFGSLEIKNANEILLYEIVYLSRTRRIKKATTRVFTSDYAELFCSLYI